MTRLEAPWLAMVSSPEMEERRREERSSGARYCMEEDRGDTMGVALHHKGGSIPACSLYKLLLLPS
jgi:hypothetical protein